MVERCDMSQKDRKRWWLTSSFDREHLYPSVRLNKKKYVLNRKLVAIATIDESNLGCHINNTLNDLYTTIVVIHSMLTIAGINVKHF